MTNNDLGRLLRSDEIQRILKPKLFQSKSRRLKRNPLKSIRALNHLNPYGIVQKRAALKSHLKIKPNLEALLTKSQQNATVEQSSEKKPPESKEIKDPNKRDSDKKDKDDKTESIGGKMLKAVLF